MDSERWQRIKQVFGDALELPPGARTAFLDSTCAADPDLRVQVEDLLRLHVEAEDFIEEPAVDLAAGNGFPHASAPVEGRMIGPYKIVRELGHGGMGAVYLAVRDDDQFQMNVALKLIRRGWESDFTARRLRAERQILAGLDHPNIARLFDGGVTSDGDPYFVMEFVAGIPIDEYCRGKNLSVRERLELFRTVCSAVQYAHQNLVVHRDLKPGNVLVTADGVPKLLDFGIAKITRTGASSDDPKSATVTSRMMTPEYASPEQIKNDPITTASDIHSLGVMLYELLTGRRPFHVSGRDPLEIARAVCEREPEPPSRAVSRPTDFGKPATGLDAPTTDSGGERLTRDADTSRLRRELSGDIDTIVLTALRKEPRRRYASVERLSDDIRRYLEGLPVAARGDTFSYRAAKFVRRNRTTVAAAALAVTALVVGTGIALRQAQVARREQARAEQRFNDVRRLANKVLFVYHDGIADLPGTTGVRETMVKDALEYLDRLNGETINDPTLLGELAAAYQKVGDVQSGNLGNVGNVKAAFDSQRKALDIRKRLAEVAPDSPAMRRELSVSYDRVADLHWRNTELKPALECFRQVVALRETLAAVDPSSVEAKRDLAAAYLKIGALLGDDGRPNLGDMAGAKEFLGKGLKVLEGILESDPNDVETGSFLAEGRLIYANLTANLGDLDGALAVARQALGLVENLAAKHPDKAVLRENLAAAHTKTADILSGFERYAEAVEHQRKAVAGAVAAVKADPTNREAARTAAQYLRRLARVLQYSGNLADSEARYRESLAGFEALATADPADLGLKSDVAVGRSELADVLAEGGRHKEALGCYEDAGEVLSALVAAEPSDMQNRGSLALNNYNIGKVLMRLGEPERAIGMFRNYVKVNEAFWKAEPSNAQARRAVGMGLARLGQVHAALSKRGKNGSTERRTELDAACRAYRSGLEHFRELKAQGALPPYFEDKSKEFEAELAGCEADLARLNKGS